MYKNLTNNPIDRDLNTYAWTYWDNMFSNEEIENIKEYCSKFGTEKATILGQKSDENITDETVDKIRRSKVKFHNINSDNAWIFEKLNFIISSLNESYYNYNLNGYDAFQYTEYDINDEYTWHQDIVHGKNTLGHTRKLSLSLNLTESGVDYTGGQFQINTSSESDSEFISQPKGRAIVFPSYTLHRVKPVITGVRKSLVVWVTGPKFI